MKLTEREKAQAKTKIKAKDYKDIRDIVLVTEAMRVSKSKGKNWQEFKDSLCQNA